MLQAIIYLRVSTKSQAEEGTSLETQRNACLAKAAELGAEVVEVLTDEGISGALLLSRPAVQKALKLIEAGTANVLLCYDLSRLSRDVEHQAVIKRRVESAGARMAFVMGHYSDDEEGDLFFTIDGGFKQYERRVIRRRTMKGRLERARSGVQPCRSRSPHGFHIPTKEDILTGAYAVGTLGTYQIVETEAAAVREIFHRYANGASLRGLATWLNDSGIPANKGMTWRHTTLRQILRNPAYKGEPVFGKSERLKDEGRMQEGKRSSYTRDRDPQHWVMLSAPVLVSPDVWQTCNERLERNQSELGGRPSSKYLLSGLMRCPECGCRLIYNPAKRSSSYRCQNRHGGKRPCFNAAQFEDLVIDMILDAAERPEVVEEALASFARTAPIAETTPQDIERELTDLAAKETATVKAQIAGIQAGADPAIYAGLFQEIRAQRQVLESRLETVQASSTQYSEHPKDAAGKLAQALSDVREALRSEDLTTGEKNSLLRLAVVSVLPCADGVERLRLAPVKIRDTVHDITASNPPRPSSGRPWRSKKTSGNSSSQ